MLNHHHAAPNNLAHCMWRAAKRIFNHKPLDASAEQPLATVELTGPVALVIGSEDEGVSRGVRKLCSTRAKLPMSRLIDSLNASVAAAVALYEACRQRTVGQ